MIIFFVVHNGRGEAGFFVSFKENTTSLCL
jgi:hypothetical protein